MSEIKNPLIRKSAPLIYAEWLELTPGELKILEIYLSRIDIKNKKTAVRFTREELAELFGYKDYRHARTKDFKKRLSKFLKQQISIDLEDGKGYGLVQLFSDAVCYRSEEDNGVYVDIDCNQKFAPVFIYLADGSGEGHKYISYRFSNTRNLKSGYSIKLYNLLLDHAWGNHKWIVKLDELKRLLGASDKTYEDFKYFNHHVLKKAQKEINENTNITFTYEQNKKARRTTGITFKITKGAEEKENSVIEIENYEVIEEEPIPGQTTIEEYLAEVEIKTETQETVEVENLDQKKIYMCKECYARILKEHEVSDEHFILIYDMAFEQLAPAFQSILPEHYDRFMLQAIKGLARKVESTTVRSTVFALTKGIINKDTEFWAEQNKKIIEFSRQPMDSAEIAEIQERKRQQQEDFIEQDREAWRKEYENTKHNIDSQEDLSAELNKILK